MPAPTRLPRKAFTGRDRATVKKLFDALKQVQRMDARRTQRATDLNLTPVLYQQNPTFVTSIALLLEGCGNAFDAVL